MTVIASPPEKSPTDIALQAVDQDRDVATQFPVKRLTHLILYANMICLGGAFAGLMAFGTYMMAQYTLVGYSSPGVPGFLQLYKQAVDQLWTFAIEDLSQTMRFLFLACIPGTIVGLAWYLVLRWRESVILRKRLRAAGKKASQPPIFPA